MLCGLFWQAEVEDDRVLLSFPLSLPASARASETRRNGVRGRGQQSKRVPATHRRSGNTGIPHFPASPCFRLLVMFLRA